MAEYSDLLWERGEPLVCPDLGSCMKDLLIRQKESRVWVLSQQQNSKLTQKWGKL